DEPRPQSRAKPATAPPPIPPIPPGRVKGQTKPPAVPLIVPPIKSAPVKAASPPPAHGDDPPFTRERTPPVIVDVAERISDPNLAVPVGEFDGGGVATPEQGKLRASYSQQETVKRDAADALLQVP